MDTPVFTFVQQYLGQSMSRLHMPGHKGQGPLGCEALDITEIQGADSLYTAQGILAQSQRNATFLFQTGATFYSTEGSSQCIKAMLYLAQQQTGRRLVLAARNVHKAFVQAAALLDLEVQWLWAKEPYQLLSCQITAEQLEQALAQLSTPPACVYVTSPDYLGQMQPIGELAQICHKQKIPLLVDNAHGAYLHFLPKPLHPMDQGADMCADSAHKTLPVLTGGAYLHLAGPISQQSQDNAQQALALFGSTSPSYLILQSLDLCNATLAQDFPARLAQTIAEVAALKEDLLTQGWAVQNTEPLKLVVQSSATGYFGTELADLLRSFQVECEYADRDHLVLMFSPPNSKRDYARIRQAFFACPLGPNRVQPCFLPPPQQAMSIRQGLFSPWEELPVQQSVGRICAAPMVSCPPAVPVVISGEIIPKEALPVFAHYGIETIGVVQET